MCGVLPEAHWCSKSVVSSRAARGGSSPASPMEMNVESQLHWCGYRSGASLVQPPMTLRRNSRAAYSNIPEKGTPPPLAAASGHIIPDSRAERDTSVLWESEKLGPQ